MFIVNFLGPINLILKKLERAKPCRNGDARVRLVGCELQKKTTLDWFYFVLFLKSVVYLKLRKLQPSITCSNDDARVRLVGLHLRHIESLFCRDLKTRYDQHKNREEELRRQREEREVSRWRGMDLIFEKQGDILVESTSISVHSNDGTGMCRVQLSNFCLDLN